MFHVAILSLLIKYTVHVNSDSNLTMNNLYYLCVLFVSDTFLQIGINNFLTLFAIIIIPPVVCRVISRNRMDSNK